MQVNRVQDDTVALKDVPVIPVVVRIADMVADGHPAAALFIGEKWAKFQGGAVLHEPFWFWMATAAESMSSPKAAQFWTWADELNPAWANRKTPAVS